MTHNCSNCGSRAHSAKFCPKTAGGQANRQAMRCSYCGGRNHYRAACPKTVARHLWKPDQWRRD